MTDIIERLKEIAHAIAEGNRDELTMRIPADPDRDADIVVMRAAAELTRLRAALADAEAERDAVKVEWEKATAERDAMRADAERYRWLRANAKRTMLMRLPASYAPDDIDAALDAARGAAASAPAAKQEGGE